MNARCVAAVGALLLLCGCGIAGVGGAAAVQGAGSAEEAKAAQQQIEKVQADIDAAQKKAAEMREAAEAE